MATKPDPVSYVLFWLSGFFIGMSVAGLIVLPHARAAIAAIKRMDEHDGKAS